MLSSIGALEIIISKCIISKPIPFWSGLVGFVLTSCSFYLEPKMWEITHVVLVLVPISTKTKLVVHTWILGK
jgi:hypothetical protein